MRAAEGGQQVPLPFFIAEVAGVVGVALAVGVDMDQGSVSRAGLPGIVHEALAAGALSAEVLRRYACPLAERLDAHVFRNGAGVVGLIGAPDGEEDGVGAVRMGLDAHIALLESGEHIIGGRHGSFLRDSGFVVEPFGVALREIVEQMHRGAAAVPVTVIDLVFGCEVQFARKGRSVRVEGRNPIELRPRRLGGVSLDIHPDIAGRRHVEGSDVIGSGGGHVDLAGGPVAGEGEFVGLRSGRLRGLESQVQASFSLRAEIQRKHGRGIVPRLEAAVAGVYDPGRLSIEGTGGFRDEDIALEGDDDGVRGGFEGRGGGVSAGCGEKEDGQQRFE